MTASLLADALTDQRPVPRRSRDRGGQRRTAYRPPTDRSDLTDPATHLGGPRLASLGALTSNVG